MPTLDWLRNEFAYGYDSGNVLSLIAGPRRRQEERKIGGSYRQVFKAGVLPHLQPDSTVLELGPGRGSWSRAILKHIPRGRLHTVDFRDVNPWLRPDRYSGRLVCHQVSENSLSVVEDEAFDFFWSFGVLCHNEIGAIKEVLSRGLRKMRPGGISVHHYGDWEKLDQYGWEPGAIPQSFKSLPDSAIWWPRNNRRTMAMAATEAGWEVLTDDLGLIRRDSIILLRAPL